MQFTKDIEKDILLCADVRASVDTWTADVSSDTRFTETLDRYQHSTSMKLLIILGLLVVAALITIFSLQYGDISTDAISTLEIIWNKLIGADTDN